MAPVADRIGPGVVVLLRTGWSRHYGSPAYFEHPFLAADACERMLDLGARTFCIDAINIDETPDDDHPGVGFPCHHLISRLDGVIGENFRLDELPDGDFLVVLYADPAHRRRRRAGAGGCDRTGAMSSRRTRLARARPGAPGRPHRCQAPHRPQGHAASPSTRWPRPPV